MSEHVLFDEIRLLLRVPANLDEAACNAIRQVLQGRPFRAGLRRAIRQFLRRHPELTAVRVRISG